jgi:hypothetical protein
MPSPPISTTHGSRKQKVIDDIAEVFKDAEKQGCNVEILYDGSNLWQLQPTPLHLRVTNHNEISLEYLLRNATEMHLNMSLKNKRILALLLAHCLLEFCGSPWLRKGWSKRDISFFQSPSEDGKIDLTRPFLTADFEGSDEEEEQDSLCMLHPCPAVLALGIVLLEIQLCASIESQRTEEDMFNGKENINTDYTTALRLLKSLTDDVFLTYRNAIEACLKLDNGLSSNFEDADFRQMMYEKVVMPLKKEISLGWGENFNDI